MVAHIISMTYFREKQLYRLSGKNYEVSVLASNTGRPEGRRCLFINKRVYICLES